MRLFALPIAICLASFGCAASEESEPADDGAGSTSKAGSLNVGGNSVGTGGQTGNAGSGVVPMGGTGPSGTAGTSPATAGTAPTAGTTGTGGAAPVGTCKMSATAAGTLPLIDDFEDGNADVMQNEGRIGGWFLATDLTGTTTPKAPIAPLPEVGGMPGKALHVSGSGLTGWGASLSATLTVQDGCYDASKATGVTVMLKGTGSVWVSVLTAAVRAAPDGQKNHFKKQVTLTGEWQTFTVLYTELTQPGGWGVIVPFDATKIYGIDFGPATAPPAPTAFDFWVDNLSFK